MVDSIANNLGSVSTLLRAQSAGAPAINGAQTPAQALINQQSNGAKPTTVQPSVKSAGASSGDNLPRGSLVDILV